MDMQLSMDQKQTISPNMQQSAAILQMNRMELHTFLQNTALENPLLDFNDSIQADYSSSQVVEKYLWLEECDKQNRIYYEQDYKEEQESQEPWQNGKNRGEDLADYVLSQFISEPMEEREREILEFLAHSLDQNGYFTEDILPIAKRFQVDPQVVVKCLKQIQTADPAGVGAGSLKECLLIQLDLKQLEVPVARILIEEHLDALSKNKLSQISKKLKISMGDLLVNYKIIQELNPKPGNGFATRENLRYVRPDITVVKFEDRFEILENETFSNISVNPYYVSMLKEDLDQETQTYILEKLAQAKWVANCIEKRGSTLNAVVKAIVKSQQEFFQLGYGYLKPLNLKQTAKAVNLHESTVSRAVKAKYLQCQWGIFPLNYFFSKGIYNKETAREYSDSYIKKQIKELIESEDKKNPLSDQSVTEMLSKLGISISRRTVAKYRDSMGVKTRGERKEF